MSIAATAIRAAIVLLVPKSLTFHVPVSNGAPATVVEISTSVEITPTAAAMPARMAMTSSGRSRKPGRSGSRLPPNSWSRVGSSPVTVGDGGGGAVVITIVGPGSAAGGASTAQAGAGGGGGTVDILVVSAASCGEVGIWAVVDPVRATAIAGTSPVSSATPRSDCPHSMQNFCPVRTSVPHEGHCMGRAYGDGPASGGHRRPSALQRSCGAGRRPR
jgi:hypothetical protein